jgi:hypothetical protein
MYKQEEEGDHLKLVSVPSHGNHTNSEVFINLHSHTPMVIFTSVVNQSVFPKHDVLNQAFV